MEKCFLFLFAAVFAASVHGAWYWPFNDRDGTNAPPRLHRLLQPANDYIELAQDASLDGDADKALENYKLALGELDRVEAENPERAATSEFAPLRSRRAACTAAMEAIRFAQINENVRPLAVTDTRELQEKWNRKHGITNAAAAASAPDGWEARIANVTSRLREKDYKGANALLDAMLKERPKDLNALLLRAAGQAGAGDVSAAQQTLERAMRAHPKSYLPYYNLASLAMRQGSLESAREYYELGRVVGGPESGEIEAMLKKENDNKKVKADGK